MEIMLLVLFGMTSGVGGGNGFGASRHDRL